MHKKGSQPKYFNRVGGKYRRTKPARTPCSGRDYSDEEREFILVMERWKKETGTKFPQLTDILAVLKAIGYRKVEKPEKLPKPRPKD